MNDVDHRNQAHGWVSGCAATQSICDGAATEENNILYSYCERGWGEAGVLIKVKR